MEHHLPRRLHRAVLRLLRPLESATRRLIIVAARDLPVPALPPPRPRKSEPNLKTAHAALRSLGLAVVLSSADIARAAAEKRAAEKRAANRAARAGRPLVLPIADPLKRFGPRRKYVPAYAAPRIIFFHGPVPHRLPPPPSPHDPVDATRLRMRLQALAGALDDLPGHARRFARWRALRARNRQKPGAGRIRRISPLRPGLAPGLSRANRRRPSHEVHDVLADMQYFAWRALEQPDTS